MKKIDDETKQAVYECAESVALRIHADIESCVVSMDINGDELWDRIVRHVAQAAFEGILGFYENDTPDDEMSLAYDEAEALAAEYGATADA
jgi:hypothetical protein